MGVNIVAVVLAIVGAIFFQASPLGAVQMLWVNLIMDSLASLALATEEPEDQLLEGLSDDQTAGGQLRIGWFAGCAPSQHYTILFNTFVMMTLFNQFASRKLHGELNFCTGLLANKPFIVLSVVELGLQALFVQALGAPVGCVPGGLTGGQWGWCLLFGLIGWFYQLAINMVFDMLYPEV